MQLLTKIFRLLHFADYNDVMDVMMSCQTAKYKTCNTLNKVHLEMMWLSSKWLSRLQSVIDSQTVKLRQFFDIYYFITTSKWQQQLSTVKCCVNLYKTDLAWIGTIAISNLTLSTLTDRVMGCNVTLGWLGDYRIKVYAQPWFHAACYDTTNKEPLACKVIA